MMDLQRRIPLALLSLRLGVFLVMLMWTLDKFVAPDHAAGIFGFDNLLFFAAWPMLAACFSLYLLRDQDTLGTVVQQSASASRQDSVRA